MGPYMRNTTDRHSIISPYDAAPNFKDPESTDFAKARASH
ncbi:unnamed protein product [Penicillium roqueforti FM164]|uniref:Genomic scaffold, ProqFM164S02 n=1 Tax=Penicillium roqueforti (strain FM164) TaxID=1365484 RepID=W6QNS2_PENRF|nr:unnamed protein product [Penicillium roqueforti FM164]